VVVVSIASGRPCPHRTRTRQLVAIRNCLPLHHEVHAKKSRCGFCIDFGCCLVNRPTGSCFGFLFFMLHVPTTKRSRKQWTKEEVEALRIGVQRHQVGNWMLIKNDPGLCRVLKERNTIDIKDKVGSFSLLCVSLALYLFE
jgi:hypothetical protein